MEIEEHFFTSASDADFQLHYERYGDVFYDAVDRAIGQLRQFPESGPIYEDTVISGVFAFATGCGPKLQWRRACRAAGEAGGFAACSRW